MSQNLSEVAERLAILEEQLTDAKINARTYRSFYTSARKTNKALWTVVISLATLLGLSSSCPRTVIQKETFPYYMGQVEPHTYKMDVNEDGLLDKVHVSEFPPRIELQNKDETYRPSPEWKPAGYDKHIKKQKGD